MLSPCAVATLAVSTLALAGCQPSPPFDSQPVQGSAPIPSATNAASCALPAYEFATLRTRFSAPSRLSAATVAALVRRNPQLPDHFARYQDYEQDLFAIDTLRCAQYWLVPLLYRYDDCCEDLYYLTFAPGAQQLRDWQRVASRGADGFWQQQARLQAHADGHLTVTSVGEDEDSEAPESQGRRYVRDSVVRTYRVSAGGRLTRLRVDSIRTTHLHPQH
jgi:hypothetical protein